MASKLKIALVHDWLMALGGAEKTLREMHRLFPEAPIFTLFRSEKFTNAFLPQAKIKTTFLQKSVQRGRRYRTLLPLMGTAVESIDLSGYDIVISSSASFTKGVITDPQTKHICYCYSPTRFLWDWHAEYKRQNRYGLISALAQHTIRFWDQQAAQRPDYMVAISKTVQARIKKYYRRDSEVIYPPVDFIPPTQNQHPQQQPFYLIVSRLYAHKNIDIAIQAFNKLGHNLVIIGDGPERKNLEKQSGANITFLGFLDDSAVHDYYSKCLAFIMPQEEDFGLTPIEAMFHGRPVLALNRGGAKEYILENINGEFFQSPTPEVLADGVRRLSENLATYSPELIKKTANRFTVKRFHSEFKALVDKIARE